MFSPILCAGLLFGSAIKRSTSLARDYGTNLLGAMVGGVGEYLSLVTGFRALLFLIALCYIGAIVRGARRRQRLQTADGQTSSVRGPRRSRENATKARQLNQVLSHDPRGCVRGLARSPRWIRDST